MATLVDTPAARASRAARSAGSSARSLQAEIAALRASTRRRRRAEGGGGRAAARARGRGHPGAAGAGGTVAETSWTTERERQMRKLIAMAGLGLLGLWSTAAQALALRRLHRRRGHQPVLRQRDLAQEPRRDAGVCAGAVLPGRLRQPAADGGVHEPAGRQPVPADLRRRAGDEVGRVAVGLRQRRDWRRGRWRHGDQRPRRHRPSGQPEPDHRGGVDQPCPGVPAAAGLQQRAGAEEQRGGWLGVRHATRPAPAR